MPIRPRFVPIRARPLDPPRRPRFGGRHADRRPRPTRLPAPRPRRAARRRAADRDRLDGGQLHLGRGRPLAGERLRTVRDALGDRSRRLRLRRARAANTTPARVYGASEADGCHRSDVAPIESAPIAVDLKVNLACSGAKARDLWPGSEGGTSHFGEPPQADQLAVVARRDQVRMVVVTVGANDVGFGELVADCALDWARSPEDEEADLPSRRRGPDPRRVARGDPRRSPRRSTGCGGRCGTPGTRAPTTAWSRWATPPRSRRAAGSAIPRTAGRRLTEGGCPVWDADADWAADRATVDLGEALRAAAAASGAEYLDLTDAFDGHQLCDRRAQRVGPAGPSPLTAEWFRRLSFTQGSTRESLHPERLRPAGDGRLPRPPLRPPPRRLRLRRHPRPVARRRPPGGRSDEHPCRTRSRSGKGSTKVRIPWSPPVEVMGMRSKVKKASRKGRGAAAQSRRSERASPSSQSAIAERLGVRGARTRARPETSRRALS